MCIRDRYQRRVHGENFFKMKWSILSWVFAVFLHCALLNATMTKQDKEYCYNSSFTVLEVMRYFSDFLASNQTDTIISKMIEKLEEIENITSNVHKKCIDLYIKLITNSKASWDASLCLYHLENLRFRAAFAAHALSKTKDKEFALQNMRELAISCLLYTSPSPRDRQKSRMPSSA
eukprot:TRINITY_DN4784_c0_g1_i1.p1 TRINITY_DN4784_c0_g1~~TRINITY_DN4784_c0_g1_i1.p1  ORF type:complete len:176 (+),score=26.85 TRINITY_DN4784_c0_g1_i1:64-591(+)